MPIALAAGDLVEVTVNCAANDQYSANVFHYTCASVAGTAPTDLNAATSIEGVLAPLYKAVLSEGALFWGVKVQIIKPTRRPGQYISTNRGGGLVAGDIIPTQVAGLITCGTDKTGRSYRGKSFIPFPSEGSSATDGTPVTAYQTAVTLIRNVVYGQRTISPGGGGTAVLDPVVFSRLLDVITAVTSTKTSPLWATLRKRAGRSKGDVAPG